MYKLKNVKSSSKRPSSSRNMDRIASRSIRTNQYLKGYPQAISTVLRKEKTG